MGLSAISAFSSKGLEVGGGGATFLQKFSYAAHAPVSFSMKRLGVLLLHPRWDASPSQGYPQHICWFVHLGEEKLCESKVSCLRTQHNDPGLLLKTGYNFSVSLNEAVNQSYLRFIRENRDETVHCGGMARRNEH